jgi:LCP family protein required for cell wall assembly
MQPESQPSRKIFFVFCFLFFVFCFEVIALGIIFGRAQTFTGKEKLNFLILGEGGAGHEAADLTDTIILVSANQRTGKISLFSLPRDLWLPPLKTKINSLYHYGGFPQVKQEVSSIVDQPIQEVILVNFSDFLKIIDTLGGIHVLVDRSFDDYFYPVAGRENDACQGDPKLACRYEHIRFTAGWQKMDSQTALKFVRSRHSEDLQEGTDQARARRQQKVLLAVIKKMASPKIFSLAQKVLIQGGIKTEISQKDCLSLAKFFLPFLGKMKIESFSLDEFFYHPQFHSSGQWVLLPTGGNWEKMREYVNQKISE